MPTKKLTMHKPLMSILGEKEEITYSDFFKWNGQDTVQIYCERPNASGRDFDFIAYAYPQKVVAKYKGYTSDEIEAMMLKLAALGEVAYELNQEGT